MQNAPQRIIWLASFPKSGNTWVRTFLANYFLGKVELNRLRDFTTGDGRIDFFQRAAGGTYPADADFPTYVETRRAALRLIATSREGTHFVKTHTRIDSFQGIPLIPPELTAAAVYVMRNPFDIAPSFARHTNVDLDKAITMMTSRENMMRSDQGIWEFLGRWDDHIESWTGATGLPQIVLRYEDLHASPAKEFRTLFQFLKVKPEPPRLARALKATSFDALRKVEATEGFIERPPHMERFFHSGQAGGWRETLSEAQVARLVEAFEPALQRWYPELVEEVMTIAGRAGA